MEIRERLFRDRSEFQEVEVVDTTGFGKMLLLDGAVMLTERDEFIYHEMIVHPGLFAHGGVEHVLIVGGGDGGTIREVLKHESVQSITLVEIDGMVIDVARRFFPTVSIGMDDPRVTIEVADGFAYLDAHPAQYDVIIVDSTDPVPLTSEGVTGPAEPLFTPEFYGKLHGALRPGGLVAIQSENPFYSPRLLAKMHRELSAVFARKFLYSANIPTYPGGYWTFTIASDEVDFTNFQINPAPPFLESLRYFQPAMFPGALVLPRYVESLLTE